MSDKTKEKETTGWFVVKWILPFFGVMLLANIVFVWFALSTHTGTQVDNAYEEGSKYNQVLEQARKREKLGWQIGLEVEDNEIFISLFDKDGSLIEDAEIIVYLFSPRSASNDKILENSEISKGKFKAAYSDDVDGQWELRLTVIKDDTSVEYRRKLVLS